MGRERVVGRRLLGRRKAGTAASKGLRFGGAGGFLWSDEVNAHPLC
jgi:hypothetical protein